MILLHKVQQEDWQTQIIPEKINSISEYEKTMQKAERMWQKTKLEIHYSIYKDSLHAFNVELATARKTFFSNLINSNLNNTCNLFVLLRD